MGGVIDVLLVPRAKEVFFKKLNAIDLENH